MATPQQLCFLGAINEYLLQQGLTAWHLRVTDPGYRQYQMVLQRIIASNNDMWKMRLKSMVPKYGGMNCPTRFLLHEQLFIAQCMAQFMIILFDTLQVPVDNWPIYIGMTTPLARMSNIYHTFAVHGETAVLRAIACLSLLQQDIFSTTVRVHDTDVYPAFLLLEPKDLLAIMRFVPETSKQHTLYVSLSTFLQQHAEKLQTYLVQTAVDVSLQNIDTWSPTTNTSISLKLQKFLLKVPNTDDCLYKMLLAPFMYIIKLPANVPGASWSVGVLRAMGIVSERTVDNHLQGVDLSIMFQHIQGLVAYSGLEPWHAFTAERQLQSTLQSHYHDLRNLYMTLFQSTLTPIQLVPLCNIPTTSYLPLLPVLRDAHGHALRPII